MILERQNEKKKISSRFSRGGYHFPPTNTNFPLQLPFKRKICSRGGGGEGVVAPIIQNFLIDKNWLIDQEKHRTDQKIKHERSIFQLIHQIDKSLFYHFNLINLINYCHMP